MLEIVGEEVGGGGGRIVHPGEEGERTGEKSERTGEEGKRRRRKREEEEGMETVILTSLHALPAMFDDWGTKAPEVFAEKRLVSLISRSIVSNQARRSPMIKSLGELCVHLKADSCNIIGDWYSPVHVGEIWSQKVYPREVS